MLIVELLHIVKYPQIMEILKRGSKFNFEMDNVYKSSLEIQCYNLRDDSILRKHLQIVLVVHTLNNDSQAKTGIDQC